jgi:parvulin-like peptidyl-prolyl isomerase
VKRIAAAGAALVAAVVASGCGAVPSTDVAARVADEEMSVERLETVLQSLSSSSSSAIQRDEATGTVNAGVARNVLSAFVTVAATHEFLAQHGEAITEEDRQAFLETVAEDDPTRDQPEVLELIVELNAGNTALQRVAAPDAATLQARYEESPASLGVLCVRHVQLDDEASAREVAAEIEAGASVEELAVERSQDSSAPQNGGAIELSAGRGCVGVPDAVQQGLPQSFLDAALTLTPGSAPAVAQTGVGWHVIVARPYDEIADGLAEEFAAGAGRLLFSSYLRDLDVRVDPRYGRWDAAAGAVVAL